MASKKILIDKESGGTLACIHYFKGNEFSSRDPQDNVDRPFVILCHGFTGDKFEWGRFTTTAKTLLNQGYESILFDFSGSGKTKRIPVTLSKQIEDLKDVHRWAMGVGYENFGTIGLSFGGLTSLIPQLAGRKCAVFWAPAFYMRDVMGKLRLVASSVVFMFRSKPIKIPSNNNEPLLIDENFFQELKKLAVNEILQKFTLPSLVVQGKDDSTVRPTLTREAFSRMPNDEHHEYVEVENATHDFDGPQLEEFIEHSVAFLNKYLKT